MRDTHNYQFENSNCRKSLHDRGLYHQAPPYFSFSRLARVIFFFASRPRKVLFPQKFDNDTIMDEWMGVAPSSNVHILGVGRYKKSSGVFLGNLPPMPV